MKRRDRRRCPASCTCMCHDTNGGCHDHPGVKCGDAPCVAGSHKPPAPIAVNRWVRADTRCEPLAAYGWGVRCAVRPEHNDVIEVTRADGTTSREVALRVLDDGVVLVNRYGLAWLTDRGHAWRITDGGPVGAVTGRIGASW